MNYIKDIKLLNIDHSYNMIVEILKNTKDKTELNDNKFDHIENVYKVKYKYPYYYGCFPETLAGDGDPLDVILLTKKKRNRLDIVKVKPLCFIKTIDENKIDCKVIVKDIDEDLKGLNKQLVDILYFLHKCTKKNNTIIENKIYVEKETIDLINDSHNKYFKSFANNSLVSN